jgi:hypothetical protein
VFGVSPVVPLIRPLLLPCPGSLRDPEVAASHGTFGGGWGVQLEALVQVLVDFSLSPSPTEPPSLLFLGSGHDFALLPNPLLVRCRLMVLSFSGSRHGICRLGPLFDLFPI